MAIRALQQRINDQFAKACFYLLNCQGRIVVMGMENQVILPIKLQRH